GRQREYCYQPLRLHTPRHCCGFTAVVDVRFSVTAIHWFSRLMNRHRRVPLKKSMQSVSAFLVWCSTFSQGLIFIRRTRRRPSSNEML
ncbi:hypothetical protein, partial [Pseudomonas sp.]|uniref:hypothetical protein n=2 Tax=Pseudomonas TaxID=286 RepID=UPI0028ABA9E2